MACKVDLKCAGVPEADVGAGAGAWADDNFDVGVGVGENVGADGNADDDADDEVDAGETDLEKPWHQYLICLNHSLRCDLH